MDHRQRDFKELVGAIQADRQVSVKLKELVQAYLMLENILSFFNAHQKSLRDPEIKKFIGDLKAPGYHALEDVIYKILRPYLPSDIEDILAEFRK